MSKATKRAQSGADREAPAAELSQNIKAFRSECDKSVQQAHAKGASAWAQAESRYQKVVKDVAQKAERAWIESYEAYLSAYKRLHQNADEKALEAVRDAWAAHAAACTWAPELVETWDAAYQRLVGELQEVERSFVEAIRSATDNYSKNLRASVSAFGLDSLDIPAVEFVAHRMTAIEAAASAD